MGDYYCHHYKRMDDCHYRPETHYCGERRCIRIAKKPRTEVVKPPTMEDAFSTEEPPEVEKK